MGEGSAGRVTNPFPARGADLAVKDAQVQVPDQFSENLRAALSRPLFHVPDEFITWVADQVALRGLSVPIGQVIGFTQFAVKHDFVATRETTTSATYTNLATVGPTVDGLSAGRYLVGVGCKAVPSVAGTTAARMSVQANATAAQDVDSAWNENTYGATVCAFSIKTLTGVSNSLTAKYRQHGGGTGDFENRWVVAFKYENI
jgi:hypothetical protein